MRNARRIERVVHLSSQFNNKDQQPEYNDSNQSSTHDINNKTQQTTHCKERAVDEDNQNNKPLEQTRRHNGEDEATKKVCGSENEKRFLKQESNRTYDMMKTIKENTSKYNIQKETNKSTNNKQFRTPSISLLFSFLLRRLFEHKPKSEKTPHTKQKQTTENTFPCLLCAFLQRFHPSLNALCLVLLLLLFFPTK